MNQYNEHYYIAESPFGENSLFIAADQKTADRGYHYRKIPLGEAPFFFHNAYKEEDKKAGIRRQLTDIVVDGTGLLINDTVRDELKHLEIDGMQIYPAVYIDDDDEWYETYWYVSFYEELDCLDKTNSTIEIDEDEDDDVEVFRFSLDADRLDEIPEERRLLFKIGGVNLPYIFVHQNIVDVIIAKNLTGIRFFKIADFKEGIQFRESEKHKAIESAAAQKGYQVEKRPVVSIVKQEPAKVKQEPAQRDEKKAPPLPDIENKPIDIEAMTRQEIEEFFFLIEDYVGLKGDTLDLAQDTTLIEVDDLTRPLDILKALDRLIELTAGNGIGAIRNDWMLNIAFKDRQERYLNEERFFRTAIAIPQGDQKIAEVLENYVRYGGDRLYSTAEDQTALIYTAWTLATHHPKYLELVLRFLETLDWEHIFYEREEFLTDIKNAFGTSEEYVEFLIGLRARHYEDYFEKELDETGVLYNWIQDKANCELAVEKFKNVLKRVDDADWTEYFFDHLEKMLWDGKTYLKDFALAIATILDGDAGESDFTTRITDVFESNAEGILQLQKAADNSKHADDYLALAQALADEITSLLKKPSDRFIADAREHLSHLEACLQAAPDSRIARLFSTGCRQYFSLPPRFIYDQIEQLKNDLDRLFAVWESYGERSEIATDYFFMVRVFITLLKRSTTYQETGNLISGEFEKLDSLRSKFPELAVFQDMSDGPIDIHDLFRATHRPFEFGDWIEDLTFSPNGKMIGVVGDQINFSSALLYQTDGKPLTVLETEADPSNRARRLAFSNDSRQVVVDCNEDGLCLLETQKGQLQHCLTDHTAVGHYFSQAKQTLQFSPDNRWLAAGFYEGSVWVWDCQTGQLKSSLWNTGLSSERNLRWEAFDKDSIKDNIEKRQESKKRKHEINGLLWLSDNNTLMIGTDAGLYKWDVDSGKNECFCSGRIQGLGHWQNPDHHGSYYLAVFDEKSEVIKLFDEKQQQIGMVEEVDDCEQGWLAFSKDGQHLQTIEYRYDWKKNRIIEGRDYVDLESDMWWDGVSTSTLAAAYDDDHDENPFFSVWSNHYGLTDNISTGASPGQREEAPAGDDVANDRNDTAEKKVDQNEHNVPAARGHASNLYRFIERSYKTIYADELHEITDRIDELYALSQQYSDHKFFHSCYVSSLCRLVNILVEFGQVKQAKIHFDQLQELVNTHAEYRETSAYVDVLDAFVMYFFRDKRDTRAREYLNHFFSIFENSEEKTVKSKYIECIKRVAFYFIEQKKHDEAVKHIENVYNQIATSESYDVQTMFAERLNDICESYIREDKIENVAFYAIKLGTLIQWKEKKYINYQYIEIICHLAPSIFEQVDQMKKSRGLTRELFRYIADHLGLLYDYYFFDETIEKIIIDSREEYVIHANFRNLLNDCLMAAFECGEIDEGIDIADRIQEIAHVNNHTYHSAACLYVAGGQYDKALEQLELAKQHEYGYMDRVKTDEDLRPLFEESRFRNLFTE